MSNQNSLKDTEEGTLLTPQERVACQNIMAEKSLHSQRAKALLALDGGASQAQAGQQAGLTRNQVKYWLSKFRRERLEAFPEGAFADTQAQPEAPIVEAPEEVEKAAEGAQEDQPEEKSKGSKKKKGKDKKKGSKKKKGTKKKKSKKNNKK